MTHSSQWNSPRTCCRHAPDGARGLARRMEERAACASSRRARRRAAPPRDVTLPSTAASANAIQRRQARRRQRATIQIDRPPLSRRGDGERRRAGIRPQQLDHCDPVRSGLGLLSIAERVTTSVAASISIPLAAALRDLSVPVTALHPPPQRTRRNGRGAPINSSSCTSPRRVPIAVSVSSWPTTTPSSGRASGGCWTISPTWWSWARPRTACRPSS